MARRREYGEDLTYSEEHRHRLPQLYNRLGHRLDMADRDWTEFCHYCREPIEIYEEVHDRGQNLLDKGVSVTRKLAVRANLPAYLLAWKNERPRAVDDEINALNKRIRELETAYPITGFTVRNLRQHDAKLIQVAPNDWWERVLLQHRQHHHECERSHEWTVNGHRLLAAKEQNPLTEVDLLDLVKFEKPANIRDLDNGRR